MITIKHKGKFEKTDKFFNRVLNLKTRKILNRYGLMGVEALKQNTPKDSGLTAESWFYKIRRSRGMLFIEWHNSNIVKDVSIAVILQYGHGTRNGGYVYGIDYINPALEDVFKNMADDIWREVTN